MVPTPRWPYCAAILPFVNTLDWSIFISAFVSATLLPGNPEALLLLRPAEGARWPGLLLAATVDNLLGSLLT